MRYQNYQKTQNMFDIFYGKEMEVKSKREKIKRRTMALRRQQNLIPIGY